MKKVIFFSLACAFAMGSNVSAQTCASPLPLYAGTPMYGDTCSAANVLPSYGGIVSTQNEIVYAYASTGSELFDIANTGGFAGSEAVLFLLPQCGAAWDPVAFGMPGLPMGTSGVTIPGHTYYVVATADPASSAAACGQYQLTVQ